MAPTDIDLAKTKRWLAQLHTSNLPPPASSSSSTHSATSSLDECFGAITIAESPSTSLSAASSCETSPTMGAMPPSPLTATRARILHRLCESSTAAPASDCKNTAPPPTHSLGRSGIDAINAGLSPNNINYIKPSQQKYMAVPLSPEGSPTSGGTSRSRWSRRQSAASGGAKSLDALERESMRRRFSLSKFRLGSWNSK